MIFGRRNSSTLALGSVLLGSTVALACAPTPQAPPSAVAAPAGVPDADVAALIPGVGGAASALAENQAPAASATTSSTAAAGSGGASVFTREQLDKTLEAYREAYVKDMGGPGAAAEMAKLLRVLGFSAEETGKLTGGGSNVFSAGAPMLPIDVNLDADPQLEHVIVLTAAHTPDDPDAEVTGMVTMPTEHLLWIAWLDAVPGGYRVAATKQFESSTIGESGFDVDHAPVHDARFSDTIVATHVLTGFGRTGSFFSGVELFTLQHGTLETIASMAGCGERVAMNGSPPQKLECTSGDGTSLTSTWNATAFSYR